jgi:glycine/D-amino acid oxidase-like deaminating enzyme
MTIKVEFSTPVLADVDVLVCGGGPAGIGAAVAAARQGARTMLVEMQGSLGGVGANTLVGTWLGSYSRDGAFPVVGGIFTEMLKRLAAEGAAILPDDAPIEGGRHIQYANWHKRVIPIEFEPFKRISEQMCVETGVRLRYWTSVIAPKMNGRRVEGVFVHSKNGVEFINAKMIVDATGDADVVFRAGCPVVTGRAEDGLTSPLTTILVAEDVDYAALENYCASTGDIRLRNVIAAIKQEEPWRFPFEIIISCEMIKRGRYFLNTLCQTGWNGADAEDLTQASIEGRQQAHALMDQLRRHVPGFANARLTQTSARVGVRDTRRIVGDYCVTVTDIKTGKRYEDTIALSGYQWDMADPKRPSHQRMEGQTIGLQFTEIPYRSLLPQGIDNLIVAGRNVSSEWDALGVLRIMPACLAMGQAAGTAAAMAAHAGATTRAIQVAALRTNLLQQGAILDPLNGSR